MMHILAKKIEGHVRIDAENNKEDRAFSED